MKPIQIISQDLFDKVRSRFQNLEMGDETGAVTIDPANARFFDFDFVIEGNNLGRVSISLNDLGSLKVYYSQGITENQDDPAKKQWYSFLKEMRFFAMRRLLRFDTRDIAKTNLDKNDFQHLATTQGPKEEPTMNMNESNKKQRVSESMDVGQQMAQDGITYSPEKEDELINMMADYMKKSGMSSKAIRYYLSYDEDYISDQLGYLPRKGQPEQGLSEGRWNNKSTKKTSRAVAGKTEVIVRHTESMDETYPGARSQPKKIKAIFIQNQDGERFKYPFIHPAGAFAMAQHVDHGGVPHDPAGKAIINMSEQIAQLGEFQRKVHSATLHDDATGITERAIGRLQELKGQVAALSKKHHYEAWMAEFSGVDDDHAVLDDVTMEQYKQKFTQTSFQEELSSYFPLLHRIMSEVNKIDLEDYVSEEDDEDDTVKDDTDVKEDAFDAFESWAEAVEQGKLADDEISALKQALEDLPEGELNLDTAYSFFNQFGINDQALEDKFQQAKELDPETDPMQVFQLWSKESYPELLVALGISGTEAPSEPGAAPEQSTAENEEQGGMPNSTMPTREAVVQEVAKLVKSRFNSDNPEVGPFNGAPNIALDIKKKCSEMFGEEVGAQAEGLALQFMEKLSQTWEAEHGQVANGHGDDGLARLKELVGNIKGRVEEMGEEKNPQHSHQYDATMKHADNPSVQQRMAAHDIKPGIAGYRDRIDMLKDLERTGKLKTSQEEGGPDKSQVPAYKRKEQGGDWKMSTKDLEKEKTNSPTSSAGLARKKAELGISEELAAIMRLASHKK